MLASLPFTNIQVKRYKILEKLWIPRVAKIKFLIFWKITNLLQISKSKEYKIFEKLWRTIRIKNVAKIDFLFFWKNLHFCVFLMKWYEPSTDEIYWGLFQLIVTPKLVAVKGYLSFEANYQIKYKTRRFESFPLSIILVFYLYQRIWYVRVSLCFVSYWYLANVACFIQRIASPPPLPSKPVTVEIVSLSTQFGLSTRTDQ